MALTTAEKVRCDEWVKALRRNWQIYTLGKWSYKYKEGALIRYVDVNQIHMDDVRIFLEYLVSSDCVATLSLSNQDISADGWRPNRAWYEIVQKPVGNVGGVRLFHGLVKDVEATGDGPHLLENGCAWKVTHTFYWKQVSIIQVGASESGIMRRIINVTHDDETGLYNYVLEVRERVQQDVPLYLQETDQFKDKREEAHLGVRQGVTAGQEASCDNAGTKVTKTIRKNEDCTIDIVNDVTRDKPVAEQTVKVEVGLHGSARTVTDINQSEPKPTSGLEAGEMVQNEKTPTGLFNTTVREIVQDFVGWLRGTCRKTIFRHTHAVTTAQGSDPGFTHAVSAGGGVIHEKDVQKTEFGYDVTDTTHTDQSVPSSTVRVEKMLGGVRRTTVNRNQGANAATSGLDIGDAVTNEKTESGLVDQTIVELDPADVGTIDESCDRNALVLVHSRSEVVAANPGNVDAQQVSGGVIHGKRVTRTELGGYRVTDETRTAQESSVTTHSHSEGRDTTTTHFRNAESVDESGAGVNVTVEVNALPNEFGLKDGSRQVTHHKPEARTAVCGNRHEDRKTIVREKESGEQNPSRTFSRGVIHEVTSNPNGLGSATVHEVIRTAKPSISRLAYPSVVKSSRRITTYKNLLVVFRNQEQLPDIEDGYDSCTPSYHLNDFELYDGQYHYQKLEKDEEWSGGGTAGEQWDEHSEETTRTCEVIVLKWVEEDDEKVMVAFRQWKDVTYTRRVLYSTRWNMLHEIMKHPGSAEYDTPLLSHMEDGVAVIYSNFREGEWHEEQVDVDDN